MSPTCNIGYLAERRSPSTLKSSEPRVVYEVTYVDITLPEMYGVGWLEAGLQLRGARGPSVGISGNDVALLFMASFL